MTPKSREAADNVRHIVEDCRLYPSVPRHGCSIVGWLRCKLTRLRCPHEANA